MDNREPKLSLNVLPTGGKAEQLRSAPPPAPASKRFNPGVDPNDTPGQKTVRDKVVTVLRTIYDPEIPVSIYELGLIYGIDIAEDNSVVVRMTLTAPGCPVADTLVQSVESRIETISEVPRATVVLVWEPQWSKEMMSEAALLELGM